MLTEPAGQQLTSQLLLGRHGAMTPVRAVAPPETLLDVVIQSLTEQTDLPPETGLASVITLMAAALGQSGSCVRWPGEDYAIEPSLWLVLLGPSGCGKTFSAGLIREALGIELAELPEPGSGRAFLDGMSGLHGRAYWHRDEYGQLMHRIADGGPYSDLRDYLLRSYDHARLEKQNSSEPEPIIVDHPVLTIFGGSVDSTWATCVDAAMVADGLLARHLFIVAPKRSLSVPRYPRTAMIERIAAAVPERLRERLVTPVEYRITQAAASYYDSEWRRLAATAGDIVDPAYFRRTTWGAARLAMIYHLLINQGGVEIGVEAMHWSWRLTMYFVAQVQTVVSLSDPTLADKIIRIADWAVDALRTGKCTPKELPRALIQRFRTELRTASETRYIVDYATNIAFRP